MTVAAAFVAGIVVGLAVMALFAYDAWRMGFCAGVERAAEEFGLCNGDEEEYL